MTRRFLAILLALLMLAGLFPAAALAENEGTIVPVGGEGAPALETAEERTGTVAADPEGEDAQAAPVADEIQTVAVTLDAAHFPDANFRAYLSSNVDKDGDGTLSVSEIENMYAMSIISKGISSLKGIEYFTATRILSCQGNSLTTLDLSANTALTTLNCENNNLRSLDLSANTELKTVYCNTNSLSYLKVDGCTNLKVLTCYSNALATLDLRGTPLLEAAARTTPTGTSYLTYQYDGARLAVDKTTKLILNDAAADGIPVDEEHFPDANFRAYVSSKADKDGNGYLSTSEIGAMRDISVASKGISSLKGIEYFTALETLTCNKNDLTELDLSANTKLKKVYCYSNSLSELKVDGCTNLTYLSCWGNRLTTLDLSANTALTTLSCESNNLTALDLSANTALTTLNCEKNNLRSLDLSANTKLEEVYCYSNSLSELKVDGCTSLTYLSCWNNALASLDLRGAPALLAAALTEPTGTTTLTYQYDGATLKVDKTTTLILEDSARVPGDVNGDGVVNGKDLVRLRKHLAGETVEIVEANADVTGDGVVNGKDLIRLRKHLAGDTGAVLQ